MHIYIYIDMYVCIHIYIYIEREREHLISKIGSPRKITDKENSTIKRQSIRKT